MSTCPSSSSCPSGTSPPSCSTGSAVFGSAHWKVDAIDEYAGDRPAAWLDDNIDETCVAWAEGRSAPTLIVETKPSEGLTDEHVTQLLRWADELEGWIR